MSEYYIKQRGHLEVLLESLISDDVDAYLYDSRDSAWGLIYHKPSNVIMTIGYDGVNGISLSSCLKPTRGMAPGISAWSPASAGLPRRTWMLHFTRPKSYWQRILWHTGRLKSLASASR